MERLKVEMEYQRATRELRFVVREEGCKFYQRILGNGYRWDGDTLVVMKGEKVQYYFPNAVLC